MMTASEPAAPLPDAYGSKEGHARDDRQEGSNSETPEHGSLLSEAHTWAVSLAPIESRFCIFP